ncbi:hypothetical protein [Bradyrhizobium sp. SZCCHNPS1003]|uniref:hypothetical protein n=1 Tax=Bradyrhizobium sp. SZCCHNPS1003 TaxID=3057330 RepID=UPI0028EF6B46|nr:hypothetical protein [Bradyrhizobium sp. SZCCHNPS1003]
MGTALIRRVPDIGETFEDGDPPFRRGFRVSSWLKRAKRQHGMAQDVGPDNCKLVFCLRDEAEYVSASGVCGIIRRVEDVVITGRVPWSEEWIQESRSLAIRLVGKIVW